jgi:hypothetical protein
MSYPPNLNELNREIADICYRLHRQVMQLIIEEFKLTNTGSANGIIAFSQTSKDKVYKYCRTLTQLSAFLTAEAFLVTETNSKEFDDKMINKLLQEHNQLIILHFKKAKENANLENN